jgi:hypothetical protein
MRRSPRTRPVSSDTTQKFPHIAPSSSVMALYENVSLRINSAISPDPAKGSR